MRKRRITDTSKPQEKGQSLMSLALLLGLILTMLSGVALLAPYISWVMGAEQAAYDCAAQAAQSLSQEQGYMQGIVAAQESMAAFGLDYNRAQIDLRGSWDRGGTIVCNIYYYPPLDQFPLARVVPVPEKIVGSTVLPAQYWKSRWKP